ncbi:uncharacterized protein LOC143852876 isoform X3 [Tasmannia lanceolata]|uniref:uncharacterized protein LOC143852876 isoform X3 n=1 Tax=Tasmannia lanceolata TaxID=3420 RepID=UPI004064A9AF
MGRWSEKDERERGPQEEDDLAFVDVFFEPVFQFQGFYAMRIGMCPTNCNGKHIHRQMKGVHRPNIKLKEIHLPKKITRNYVHYHEGVSPIERTSLGNLFCDPLRTFGCHKINAI